VRRDPLYKAVGEIYDCATGGSDWPGCLSSIGRLLNGTSTNLLYHDLRARGGIQVAAGADPELYRLYREYGHAIDPWALASRLRAFQSGSVVIGASLIEHGRLKQTEFYADMGRRYETTRSLIGVLEAVPHRTAALTINRGDRGDEFDAHDARRLAVLVPHLRRALTIQHRLRGFANESAHVLAAIDRLPLGVVLVDGRARPILVNRYAASLIEARDGLAIDDDSLAAVVPEADARLQRAVGSAISVARGEALAQQDSELLVPRATGRRPLCVSVSPAGSQDFYDGLDARPAALLFVVDPDRRALPIDDRLRELLSLTMAEARVAGALAAGRQVTDISDEFGVSRETVRSQVKRILDKAGAKSQSAFVRLVATESLRLAHSADDE
jgi:DNA-binding CsgD family transcriptional regulator